MKFIFSCLVVLLISAGYGQNKIKSYDYWFDSNYNSMQQQLVTPASQLEISLSIPADNVSDGFHILHLHFKDDSSRLSGAVSQYFYKATASSFGSRAIDAYQFWYDNQFANAVYQSTGTQGTLQLSVPLPAETISNGLHILNIRFHDINHQWSYVISKFIYKREAGDSSKNNINTCQYWFDNRVENSQFISVIPGEVLQFSWALQTNGLSKGVHILSIRYRDMNNQWSSTISQFVYVKDSSTKTSNNVLSKMQYWFDNKVDSFLIRTVPAQNTILLTENLDASLLPDGLHLLHLRFADSLGQWGSTVSQFFYKSASTNLTTNVITGYRYWFNNENVSGFVVNTISSQDETYELNSGIDVGCADTGKSTLHIQFKDAKGLWSPVLTDTLLVSPSGKIYRFTGDGNWSDPKNWSENLVPPINLPGCKEIVIDHAVGGKCILNVTQKLLPGAKLTVLTNKILVIPGNLDIK